MQRESLNLENPILTKPGNLFDSRFHRQAGSYVTRDEQGSWSPALINDHSIYDVMRQFVKKGILYQYHMIVTKHLTWRGWGGVQWMNSNVAVVLDLMEAYHDGNAAALEETRDVLYHS